MAVVNQDSIEKFQNLMLANNKAKMIGNTFFIER